MKRRRPEILIVGAGVAGLTLAGALEQRGIHPKLVERDANRGPGYMLGLYPIATQVLTSLGVDELLATRAVSIDRYRLWDAQGRDVTSVNLHTTLRDHGPLLGVDRASLLATLSAASPATPVTEQHVTHLQHTHDKVIATFADGEQHAFDAVVGADGVNSTVRQLLQPHIRVQSRDTGWGGWVGFIPIQEQSTDFIEQWLPGSFAGLYPVPGAVGVVVGGPAPQAKHLEPAIERHLKLTAAPPVQQALQQLQANTDARWWPFRDTRARTWAYKRVVLVGDAAAGFLPTAGIGASMAMDSAARLADELARTSPGTVPAALNFYAEHQRQRVEPVQSTSRRLARTMFVRNRALSTARDYMTSRLPDSMLVGPVVRPMRQWGG